MTYTSPRSDPRLPSSESEDTLASKGGIENKTRASTDRQAHRATGRNVPSMYEQRLGLVKDSLAILNDELDGQVLGMHVRHFSLDAHISHDGRGEDNGEVLGGHLGMVSKDRGDGACRRLTRFSPSR